MIIPKNCLKIMNDIEKAGGKAYIVGGAVRDMVLGRTPHDYDIASNLSPQAIMSMMDAVPTGIAYGTVTVAFPGGEEYEVTTFRKDGSFASNIRVNVCSRS